MNKACTMLLGEKDFTSFSKLHTDVKTNICDVTIAAWEENEHQLIFTIAADRFLRNMVRAIVGTLLDIGLGKLPSNAIEDILKAHDRANAGMSVPACGLYLWEVGYDDWNV